MMYWNGHDGMSGWGVGLMAFGMLLFWGLLIVAVVALVRYVGHAPQHHPVPPVPPVPPGPPVRPEPEQLLAERLARGEIDTDEYRRRLDALRDGRRPASG